MDDLVSKSNSSCSNVTVNRNLSSTKAFFKSRFKSLKINSAFTSKVNRSGLDQCPPGVQYNSANQTVLDAVKVMATFAAVMLSMAILTFALD